MNRIILVFISILFFGTVYSQNKIQFHSANKAECVKSDYNSLKATFSFSELEAQDYESNRGTFSWLSLPNTVIGGNEGDPQIPVINELIAVPFGAKPRSEITSFSSTDYSLADYGMHTLVPRQPSLRKDKRPEDVPFIMNETAYQTRGLRSEPKAVVGVEGVMRGIRLGKMTIEPVSYDPVNNTLRVFNDIEVEVHFDGADAKVTEDMLLKTYSPYFDIVYKQMFNNRAVTDVYTDHPDLYKTPVKMLVVTTSTYASSSAFQNWLTWKKQKGIYVDVQTVVNNASASTIKNLIYSRYNANHPTFLVIVGDETVVTYYSLWDYDSSYGDAATDLEYASVDGDVFHDMFISRMSVSSTTELNNLVNKILTYEKYTMSDPSYLNRTLLIAGWDSYWTNIIGKPTIQYANNNYFNTAHGITPYVYITTGAGQTSCYNNINNVGFINYTAHGDIQEWADPEYTNSNVNSLTNNGKYFWAMGNCCLTANFKNSYNNQTCFGEALIRAANKGAFGYIGSVPESYWFEDFYFGVGAFAAVQGTNNPTLSGTSKGCYDAMFDDTGFNTLNSVPFIGNVAVSYAHAKNYSGSVTDEYYWRAYQCFGDGSVMPYLKVPAANNVSHASILPMGATTFTVNADAKSYVAITVNNEIIGVSQVPSSGTVDVPITAQTATGTAMIVVTRNQRQPYIATVEISGEEHLIQANASPEQGGTVTGAGTYYKGTQCTLTAKANHGFEFSHWRKGSSYASPNSTYTFTVTTDASYTAEFTELEEHAIICPTVEHGTVTVSPTTAFVGDTITLSVTLESGYCFSEWIVTSEDKATIPVVNNQFVMPDSDVTVEAVILQGYNVTVAATEHGEVSADPVCALEGTTITVAITPETGYTLQALIVHKTGDASTTVPVIGRQFNMPAYDVTVVALFNVPQGEDITIGSGTSTNNGNVLPTYAYYKYNLSEQIYTAAEMGNAGTIAAIGFKNSVNTADRNLDIYLKHTSKSTFDNNTDWEAVSASDKVFSGTVSFPASGWFTIQLDVPFTYDGTSNLLLCVDDNSNTAVESAADAPKCYTYSTGARRAIKVNKDDIDMDPTDATALAGYSGVSRITYNNQIQFTMAAPTSTAAINLSTTTISGFTYVKGEGPSEAQSFNMVAAGSDDFVITAPTHYEVSQTAAGSYSNSLTLSASNTVSTNIYVRLKANLDAGEYNNETLRIQSGETTAEVTLSGEVTASNYYTFDESAYPSNMTVMAIIQIEGEEQFTESLEIGAFCGDECRGANLPMYCPPVNRYILPLIVHGNSGDIISFKLYDHEMDMEIELTCSTTLSFSEDGYGSIFNPIVLNFTASEQPVTATQTLNLNAGWIWWSTYIELNGSEGLTTLEELLGTSASMIKSKDHFVSQSGGNWSGSLESISTGNNYLILISEPINTELTGTPANPADHPLTIKNGWNWIGFPGQQPISLEEAFSNFTPADGDMIKTQDSFSDFSEGHWSGALDQLRPGIGYLYLSNSTETKTLIFPSNAK